MNENPILIQGAMQVEIDIFINKVQDIEKLTINGYEFYRGKINDVPVVI